MNQTTIPKINEDGGWGPVENRYLATSTTRVSNKVMDSTGYSVNPSVHFDDLQQLREYALIRFYSEMPDETYKIICHTNKVLKMAVDLSRAIMNGGEE